MWEVGEDSCGAPRQVVPGQGSADSKTSLLIHEVHLYNYLENDTQKKLSSWWKVEMSSTENPKPGWRRPSAPTPAPGFTKCSVRKSKGDLAVLNLRQNGMRDPDFYRRLLGSSSRPWERGALPLRRGGFFYGVRLLQD